MKNIFLVAAVCFSFTACKDKTTTPESSPNFTNVQNVNGNQPDTTTGITLDSRKTRDTTKIKDTTPR
jgi:uncharacterized lipoprotein YajG